MISEKCVVATILLIPRIPYDPHPGVQEVLRTKLADVLIDHHKIMVIDQYDGDTATGEQRQRAWDADHASHYGHQPTPPQSPKFTEVAQLHICTVFCIRARSLFQAYDSQRLGAVGQGSYLYQNDTSLPIDDGFPDSTLLLHELSICGEHPSRTMNSNATEQHTAMHCSHDHLVHLQAKFKITLYRILYPVHAEVYRMLHDNNKIYTMSFEHTDVGILHAVSARIYDLHLTRDKPTNVSIQSLASLHGDTGIAQHLLRQAIQYLNTHEQNRCRTLHKLYHVALMNIRPRYSTHPRNSTHASTARSLQKHSKMPCLGRLLMIRHAALCAALKKSPNTFLKNGIKNASQSSVRETIPTKYREKQRYMAAKQSRDAASGITRWSTPAGELRDLKWAAAFASLPVIVIDITPVRAEPYTITTFSKYQTTSDDPLKPDGTVDHLPPASDTPAQRLDKYICAKFAEKYLILLQFHTGPQHSHFGSITASITPLKEGFHDYCIPVTSPSNDVVADVLAVKGFPVEPTPAAMTTDAHGDGAAAYASAHGAWRRRSRGGDRPSRNAQLRQSTRCHHRDRTRRTS